MATIIGDKQVFEETAQELSDEQLVSRYGSFMQGAVAAFQADPSYLVDMAEHANTIAYKRAVCDAKTLEKEAQAQCVLDNKACPFACSNDGACGFGECRYASSESSKVNPGPTPDGSKKRPEGAVAEHPTYDLQATIDLLLEQRGIHTPVKLTRK